jgi:hypothetical protein
MRGGQYALPRRRDIRRPLSGASPAQANTTGVPLRFTPDFNSGAPFGCYREVGWDHPLVPGGIECWRRPHARSLFQRRRRAGVQPGVQRSGTPGCYLTKFPNPWQGVTENRIALKVSFVKRETMRLQENLKLLEERNASMMFFLSLDVTAHLGRHRLTHRERTISFLPCESRGSFERSRNPAGGIRLELTDKFRDRLVLPQFCQDVNVIGRSVDDHRDSFFVANRAAEILMRPRADFRRQPGFASLCRKDDVIQQIAIGGTHSEGDFRRPLSGAFVVRDNTPGVPLRSTPGFSSGARSGCFALTGSGENESGIPYCSTPGVSSDARSACYRGVLMGSHIGPGAIVRRQRPPALSLRAAPKARRTTARSAAPAKLRGTRPPKFPNPCQGVTEISFAAKTNERAD